MVITMVADMSKAASHHKMAAAAAKPLMGHALKKAPSGAHADIPQDIPAGKYTVAMSEDAHGHAVFTLTPGVV